MDNTKFKLILYWFLYVMGFYFLWAITYFISARYLVREISRYRSSEGSIWSEVTIGDVFWYFIFLAGVGLVILVFRLMIEKAPNSRVAAFVYLFLVVASVAFLLIDQSHAFHGYQIIGHIIVNLILIQPMLLALFQTKRLE